ncbi:hypothetical protein Cfor_10014 [Coptotermes formosanus]|jgi:hypothetical protein|uniref:Uncharacterized protein n=1 Tax=Coptotermes formosanus TaxID=36987 RepID=A0A6L2PPG1_COPFO|nr:hypothetical protein Cfor_10014 [Coptotermes formosanus]
MTLPHVVEGCFTVPCFRNFHVNILQFYLEDVPAATRGRMWLKYEGVPLHFRREVRKFSKINLKKGGLAETYRWLGPLSHLT